MPIMSDIRQAIIDAHPLTVHLAELGIRLHGVGQEKVTNRCPMNQHKPGHWCVSVNVTKQIWHCNDDQCGGSIIDWLVLERGQTEAEVFKALAKELEASQPRPTPQKPQVVATYDYTDVHGELLYQVVRYEPKTFKQRRPDKSGGWIWSMEGVSRVLYRLAEVMTGKLVAITEGEKDVESLRAIGWTATCNVGGAGKWLDAYAEFLAGKDAIIFPDNDPPGKQHAETVLKSLEGKANSIKLVRVPAPYKDVSDYLASFPDGAKGQKALQELVEKTPHTLKPLPVYSMLELEVQYVESLKRSTVESFDLGKFLPSLGRWVRPLIAGELMVVMADTGVGKTTIQQAMARSAMPLPTLFFELELPTPLMFERFMQMDSGDNYETVQQRYQTGTLGQVANSKLNHILVCGESGLTMEQIESFIHRSELKGGMKPVLVLVDYIGLVHSPSSRSRYEALSATAEQMKIIAKRTRTIVVLGTQIARPDKAKQSIEPKLHDAKDSGSIENSAGLVLGAWRPDHKTMMIKVLKNTKGKSGLVVECNFDGERMRITERERQTHYTI
jgi:DnaB-like helicase C terminal domain